MDNKVDKELVTQAPETDGEGVTGAATSRRKFTRQAVVGSAVLFSLSNRPVWSTTVKEQCVSVGFLNSVGFASGHPDAEQKIADIEKDLAKIQRKAERRKRWVLEERDPGTSYAQVCAVKRPK
tara:strand:+ start:2441 stop:2809 length:369 start_codon:yes stop_codon:yes gene_type:complete